VNGGPAAPTRFGFGGCGRLVTPASRQREAAATGGHAPGASPSFDRLGHGSHYRCSTEERGYGAAIGRGAV
jgi:hypothetical protein